MVLGKVLAYKMYFLLLLFSQKQVLNVDIKDF